MRSRSTAMMLRVSFVAMTAIAGCTREAKTTMTLGSLGTNEREILSARQAQNQAIAAFDADRVAGFWTDDVELRRGLGQLVLGRAAYR